MRRAGVVDRAIDQYARRAQAVIVERGRSANQSSLLSAL
jgi:hypothetical protein